MSARRLAAIECPRTQIDPEDDSDFFFVSAFVEERWLKKRDEDWIVSFLDEKNIDKKLEILEDYLSSGGFRSSPSDSRRVIIDRMIAGALKIKFDENEAAHDLSASSFEVRLKAKEDSQKKTSNPLNSINCSQPDVSSAISALCTSLGITAHPDPETALRAACAYIEKELPEAAIASAKQEASKQRLDLKSSFPLGVAQNKDPAVNIAARILRVLALRRLKDNQLVVNETLIHCQNVIAALQKSKAK